MQMSQTKGIKGADVYTTTGDPLLDLSVGCVRGAEVSRLQTGLQKCLGSPTALEDAAVLTFHCRNIRGGKGERDVFQALFAALHDHDEELADKLLNQIPHFGCWDDLVQMTSRTPDLVPKILDAFEAQLNQDIQDVAKSAASISLCAKWAPREGRNRSLTSLLAKRLFPHIQSPFGQMAAYRKCVASLNRRLKTVETNMCAGTWSDIEPANVPGRAGKKYNRAFLNLPSTFRSDPDFRRTGELRHPDDPDRMKCRERFVEHYGKAARGVAKVHGADTLFPHEIVKSSWHMAEDATDERNHMLGVWRSMVEKVRDAGGLGRSIFMSDFSGSMQSADKVGDTPYWVSMALGLLGAEIAGGEFKNRLMTFDSKPTWLTFGAEDDLFARLDQIRESHAGQGLSTDFQKAMDLVLETLKTNRIKPGEEPENLIVLTDMGWDQAHSSSEVSAFSGNTYRHAVKSVPWQTHVELIRESFKRAGEDMWGPGHGFQMPRIVIWNLAATASTDFHATANTPGVAMLSGWSATQFDVLMREGPRQITPSEILRVELENPAYDPIRQIVRNHIASHLKAAREESE